jgi:hypothetical protein
LSEHNKKNSQPQAKPDHGRTYRGKPSYSFPVWNGILEHREKIGPALWEFLWCVDKITKEDEHGVGWLLGKTVIDTKTIAEDLSECPDTAYDNMERLATEGYILRKRTPRGYCIGVVNSRKFSARRKSDSEKNPIHTESDSEKIPNHNTPSDSEKTPNQSKVIRTFPESDSEKTPSRRDFAVDFAVKTDISQVGADVAVRCSPDGSRGLGSGSGDIYSPVGDRTKSKIHPDALLTLEGYQAAYGKLKDPMWAAREAGQTQLADELTEQLNALDDASRCRHGFKRTFHCDYCIAAITAQSVQK